MFTMLLQPCDNIAIASLYTTNTIAITQSYIFPLKFGAQVAIIADNLNYLTRNNER